MATTRIIPLHLNKGKTINQCLADRTDYAKNPMKTDQGNLVSSFACDPDFVASEFALSKKEFPAGMRRYPTQIGVDEKGNPINGSSETWVNAYTGVKASSPCPVWVQSKK